MRSRWLDIGQVLFFFLAFLWTETSVLPSPLKPGGPPGLILEKLQVTWLEKDAAIHEDTVLCSLHLFFLNFCMLKGLLSPKWSINISI